MFENMQNIQSDAYSSACMSYSFYTLILFTIKSDGYSYEMLVKLNNVDLYQFLNDIAVLVQAR